MNDDRISRALHQQADTITLTPADPAGAMRRGNRRRTRRRAGLAGAVAVAGLLATTVAVRDGSDQQLQLGAAQEASASTYQWSVVTPKVGISYGGDVAHLADGSVYALSTAPGTRGDLAQDSFNSTLYRSSDGAEWSKTTLPSGVRSSGLTGGGDTLYSVGTSPSGGVVVGSSADGARSWSTAEIASEVAQLKSQYGEKITLGAAEIAARDASHVVVSILASTNQRLSLYAPQYPDGDYSYEWDDTGAHVYENPAQRCGDAPVSAVPADAQKLADACRSGKGDPAQDEGQHVADLTWDQLGITGALRDHFGGVAYTYVSDDGHTFERVSLPSDLPQGTASQWLSKPLAVADGYRLVLSGGDGHGSTTTVLQSADGRTWAVDSTFDGSYGGAGAFNGKAAVTLYRNDNRQIVELETAPGQWSDLDLTSAVAVPQGHQAWLNTVDYGPLGIAASVTVSPTEGSGQTDYIVHTSDGTALQVLRVSDLVHSGGQLSGLVVTPDAIVARIANPNDDDPSTPPSQQVLVGTPQ